MGKALIITTGGGTDVEEGGPNALPSMVLSGYTFYAMQDDLQTGTMPTHWPSYTHSMEPGWYLDLPWGYYTGGLTCTAKSLKDFTSATATVEQMSNGWVGWRNGARQVGTMPWWGSTGGGSIGANGIHAIPKGQHDGGEKVTQSLWTWGWGAITPGLWNQTVIDASSWASGDRWVLGDGNLVAWNIKKGINIFGVVGTFEFTGWTGPTDWIAVNAAFQHVSRGNYTYIGWVRYEICNIPFAGLWPSYGEINIGSSYDSKIWGIVLGPDANKYPNWIVYPSSSKGYLKNIYDVLKLRGVGDSIDETKFNPIICRPINEHLPENYEGSWDDDAYSASRGFTHRLNKLQSLSQSGMAMNNWRTANSNQGGRLSINPNNKNDYIKMSWTGSYQGVPATHIRMIFCNAGSSHETTIGLPSAFSMRLVPGQCPIS